MSILNSCVDTLRTQWCAFDALERRICVAAKGKIDASRSWFKEKLPSHRLQTHLDRAGGAFLDRVVKPLNTATTEWLEKSVEGPFPLKLVVWLLKAPLCAVRNIVVLFYSIIQNVLYACVHPIDALFDFCVFIIDLIHECMQPENLSKMGAAMIGAAVGHALIMGNPVSVVMASLGAAILIMGFCLGPLKAALMAEENPRSAALTTFVNQFKELPEMFFTGFLMGLFLSGIQTPVASASTPMKRVMIELAVGGLGGVTTVLVQLSRPRCVKTSIC